MTLLEVFEKHGLLNGRNILAEGDMNAQDVKHVSNAYINKLDLTSYMTPQNVREIRKVYAGMMIDYTVKKIRRLAAPQDSGNAKRTLWFYLVKNGFVKYPPKNYCEVMQANPRNKDVTLKGVYVRRCRCGARPFADRCVGYSWWIQCNCGMRGMNGDDLQEAVENWNKEEVFYDAPGY